LQCVRERGAACRVVEYHPGIAALRFRHALIHDAVYQTLLRSERQRLHCQAAALLEQEAGGATHGRYEVLAHHWAQGGRPERAVPLLLEASAGTATRAAYVESIGHAEAGLRLVGTIADAALARRLERALLAQRGHSSTAIRGYAAAEVEAAFARALELCDDDTHPDELYPIVRGLGTYYLVRGRIERADTLASQALELAERANAPWLLIDALSFAGYPAYYRGRLDESQRLLERSLTLCERLGRDDLRHPNVQGPDTAAWSLLTTVAWLRGDLPTAERAARELDAHLARLQRPFDTTFGRVWLAATRLLQRRFADAGTQAEVGLQEATARGFGTWVPAAWMQKCIAEAAAKPAPEVAATLQHVHRDFVAAGAEVSYPYYCWGIALAWERAGDADKAIEAARRGLTRALQGEETYMRAELHLVMARLLSADPVAVRTHALEAASHAESQGALAVALRAVATLHADGQNAALAALARESLAVLDGRAPVPDDPLYVQRSLAALKGSDEAVFERHAQVAAAQVPVAGT